ncbi:MAG: hypothetical protein ACRELB_25255, partial [Polyangiaceae bacterium]
MQHRSCALAVACTIAALLPLGGAGCTGIQNVHETAQAKNKACFDCHATAYDEVQTPVHAGVYPTTCSDCHSTNGWSPAAGGHPEAKFPITTGSHANAAIGCGDCHIASLGSDVGGQNTDCVHCHIGAHNTPAIDAVHASVSGYPGSTPTSPPSCLD